MKNKSNAEDKHSIVLQILKDRQKKVIATGLLVKKIFWDEKEHCFKTRHPNSMQNNRLLDTIKIKARNIISEFEIDDIDFTLNEFENRFRFGSKRSKINLFEFWNSVVRDLELSGRMGYARTNRDTINSLKIFHNRPVLYMREINTTFLDKYEVFLRSRGGSNGGISVRMRSIRTIFNLAIRRDLIKQNLYPFHKYKISKLRGKRIKHALTISEVESFKNVDCKEDIQLIHAKNYFLFSFYTRGMNFADMMRLKWSDISKKRITYARAKTQGNFSIKILPPVKEILNFYNQNRTDTNYVFPILLYEGMTPIQIENRKHKTLGHYNKSLKILAKKAGIAKNVTSYVARHSFAMCLREKGIGIDVIGETLGHKSVLTTKAYVREFGIEVLDEAVEVLLW
ncbi:site-specific integrase [Maribacter cobaltidurans]|uniref:Site-specific integrase n=1 Tax=Maribacter cobaltidurans TaxID=1178778 RepID=A0ABU7IZX8_9FLAO|nr:site-specific integrase [Maribacter cobaltidurans]